MEEVKEEFTEGFVIDTDEKAEWALKKIKEAYDEHDRLMALIVAEQAKLEDKERQLDAKLDTDTSYLKHLLFEYMQTVKCKETKTQRSYQLLTGKLVEKVGGLDYIRDEEKLMQWAKANEPGYVKVKESLDWVNLKKDLIVMEDGSVCTGSGEIVEAVKVEKKENSFDIKW